MPDKFEQKIIDDVEEFGWFGLSVAPRTDSDDPEEWFTYTIGLPKSHGWPELICFGLGSQIAQCVLTDAIAECESKQVHPHAGLELTDTLNGYSARLVDASAIPDSYFGSAIWYAREAGTPVPPARLQLFWPDKAGNFPNDPNCSTEVRQMQTPSEVA
jgi:hypothetical protein